MARSARWVEGKVVNGFGEVKLSSWKYFHDYIYQEMLDFRDYIWRGQRCDDWRLEPTLDRALKKHDVTSHTALRRQHLENFKYAVRGRRGPIPPTLATDNDWWAIGQHNGLHTPLLDWTRSPFAAAYFAFMESNSPQTQYRAVWAIQPRNIEAKGDLLLEAKTVKRREEIIEFVRPLSDENPRLVNQAALFSRAPIGIDILTWVQKYYVKPPTGWIVIKILIPNSDREMCLRSLNRMNINHLTLFPDLFGASHFCNTDLDVKNY